MSQRQLFPVSLGKFLGETESHFENLYNLYLNIPAFTKCSFTLLFCPFLPLPSGSPVCIAWYGLAVVSAPKFASPCLIHQSSSAPPCTEEYFCTLPPSLYAVSILLLHPAKKWEYNSCDASWHSAKQVVFFDSCFLEQLQFFRNFQSSCLFSLGNILLWSAVSEYCTCNTFTSSLLR